ncbi:girdin-like [Sinocyclocheilus anshuiensis]|uniref:girdin-like n=1 Tax=Sinocyclocheilus anshuiensis TaxID=1608454 RepID=UPI0007B8485D|nr:PREDICTED: girdin-like [Sinocyclocheilus anshuiensis]
MDKMEQEVFSPLLEDFLLSPLVCWVKTVSPLGSDGSPLSEFMTLVDGVYLNDIMTEINPKSSVQRAHRKVHNDPTLRIQNLSILVQQIKSCYQETLQQLVVMSLPDVLVLGRTPLSEQGLEEMRKILLLLLGCAVQCNRKEEYIDRIQTLDFDMQAAIAAHIQESPGESSMRRTESVQHLSVELADAKARIRRLRQELEEKTEQLLDCRQELEHMETEVKRLQQENLQLLCDARSLRAYRDELDALREKAVRVDKLESEVTRYKEKLHDIEFYRTRVEELKEDYQVLLETKSMLEDQLESFRARSDKHHELEKENLQLKNKVHDMEMERDMDRKRLEELLEENLMLAVAQKQSMDESLHLGWELEQLSKTTPELTEVPQKSLGHEVNELTSSQLLKLEKENQMLLKSVEELKASGESGAHLRLEKHNQKLSQQLEQLQAELAADRESLRSAESLSADLLKEKAQLEKTLETLQQNSDRQVKGLEQENDHLNQTIASLRQRSQVSAEARVKDIEKENRVLHESIKETSSKLNKMVFERKQLRKDLEHYKEKGERAEELEMEVHRLEREKENLQKRLAALAITCGKVEVLGLNKEGLLGDEESSDDRFKLLECKLESTLKSSLEIKAEKIAALEARLQESSNLNQQLRQELKTVKKNYEALRQRQEEECSAQSSPARGREDTQSKWEKQSQEATRELLKVKDRLIEVERNNATLHAEKQALRTQLKQLESQSGNLQAQILALQRQTASLQENNTTLQTQNANLQVENSTLNSRSAALMSQNAQLQTQQSGTESERDVAIREKEELRTVYDLLLHDHEKLSALHERQASEYEDLIGKHGELKSGHKSLELQHRSLENRYNQLLKQKTELEQLERDLTAEREKMISDSKSHQDTATQYQRLSEEHHMLSSTHQQLLKDNELLQTDHKTLKSQLNTARLEQTRLEAEFSKLKEQYQQLDITSAKLTNQCELLSQLKGNLEEENRHLLDQIQTLMLQNRTLLEQTMESKDLFHVEQRQYIDKLNELRRQKEKLEEKIMDQYKFYDPSPPRRRGNWITLKMRKLIKPKSRERMRSVTQTPPRSESSEGFLTLPQPDSQDSSSVGSGSNSLEDNLTHRSGRKKVEKSQTQASSNALKKLPFMRNRSKEKDQVKAVYRRSMSMNDLLQTMAVSEVQWSSSTDHLEAQHGKEFGSMDSAGLSLSLSRGPSARHRSDTGAAVSSEDVMQLSEQERAQGVMNGSASRPRSESSDVSVSRDSPAGQTSAQHSALEGKRRAKSAGSEVVSLQQFLEESTEPAESSGVSGAVPRVKSRGILRSASGKVPAGASQPGRPSLRKAESTRSKVLPRAGLSAQSKASSASLSEHLDSSSGLPRASSVISTAEGSVRRTSIHELLSKDSRQPVLVDPAPSRSQSEYSDPALHKSASMPCRVQEPELSSLQAFLGPSFTVDSIFLDSIFSEPAVTGGARNQAILSLNTSLVSSISGPPHKAKRSDEPEEDGQSLWYEYGCV